jgi:hypothetical protein
VGDPLRRPRVTLYPQKLALTSPTSDSRSIGIFRSRTKATEVNHQEQRRRVSPATWRIERIAISELQCFQKSPISIGRRGWSDLYEWHEAWAGKYSALYGPSWLNGDPALKLEVRTWSVHRDWLCVSRCYPALDRTDICLLQGGMQIVCEMFGRMTALELIYRLWALQLWHAKTRHMRPVSFGRSPSPYAEGWGHS